MSKRPGECSVSCVSCYSLSIVLMLSSSHFPAASCMHAIHYSLYYSYFALIAKLVKTIARMRINHVWNYLKVTAGSTASTTIYTGKNDYATNLTVKRPDLIPMHG